MTDGSAVACGGADLRGPDGTRVDLTGTWEGLSTLWFVTQSGSCVTIEGLSRYGGERDGESHRFVFSGDLRADFSVLGRWTWTWACSGPTCVVRGETTSVELRVGFDSDGQPTLDAPRLWRQLSVEPAFSVTLERTSLSTELPDS